MTPEKLVETEVLAWCLSKNIIVDVFDSKATWSPSAKRFKKNRGIKVGTLDLLGLNNDGIKVAIELKAPGKEKKASLEQLLYCVKVINHNGFACVVSSAAQLENIYCIWFKLEKEERRLYLKKMLPKKAMTREHKTIAFSAEGVC